MDAFGLSHAQLSGSSSERVGSEAIFVEKLDSFFLSCYLLLYVYTGLPGRPAIG